MFNYSNLKTTLTVTPEVSPSLFNNYYTKEEADRKFVEEVSDSNAATVYGRSYKKWVALGDSSNNVYCGYSAAESAEELMIDSLKAIPIDDATLSVVFTGNNTTDSDSFWIASARTIKNITLDQYGLPIPFSEEGSILTPHYTGSIRLHCYRTGDLVTGDYSFRIELNKE